MGSFKNASPSCCADVDEEDVAYATVSPSLLSTIGVVAMDGCKLPNGDVGTASSMKTVW